ncbi:MAG: ABC transporter substrate-binding protein [Burkholderiaceae bacterium]|nr:ABC transporter substrate-binding protein [Burkholderiaceae bacterium]
MKLSRRSFLNHISAATLLAGVPVWARAQAQQTLEGSNHDTQNSIINFALTPEPPVLICFANTSGTSVTVSSKVVEGLLEYDHQLTPKAQLATAWEVSPDGLTYTFQLRPDVRWHDGERFTAADVVFSLLASKAYHPRGAATFSKLQNIEAVDDLTVRLNLSQPAPYLLLALAAGETPILPAHRYTLENALQNPLNSAPIGTGPYRFKEWSRGSHIIYERNPDYWLAGRPKVNTLIFRIMPDSAARLNGLKNRSIDIGTHSPIALSEVARLGEFPHLNTSMSGYEDNATITALEFNLEREYLANPLVRQAIAHALSREQIKKIAFYGYADTTVAPVSKRSFPKYHLDAQDPYPFDVARANTLLDEAGYPRQAGGNRFTVSLHSNPFNTGFTRTAAYVRSALARVGIQATLHEQDPGNYIRSVYTNREFDLTVSGVSTMFDPTVGLQRIYYSKSFNPAIPFSNANRYHNPEVDRLLEAAAIETDDNKRAEYFKAFQEIVIREIPTIALVQVNDVTVFNRRLSGFDTAAAGTRSNLALLEASNA